MNSSINEAKLLFILQCWPVPHDALFVPLAESLPLPLPPDESKAGLDEDTDKSHEPDISKVITYGFGALGLTKYQNYCTSNVTMWFLLNRTYWFLFTKLLSPTLGTRPR